MFSLLLVKYCHRYYLCTCEYVKVEDNNTTFSVTEHFMITWAVNHTFYYIVQNSFKELDLLANLLKAKLLTTCYCTRPPSPLRSLAL